MRLHRMRDRLRQGGLIGMFISLPAPSLVESLGGIGFDALVLDAEHAAFGIAELEALIRAADVAGLPALVRVAAIGPDIGRALDLGAAGVIVPRVESVAQAERIVAEVRFPPDGARGAGAVRACDYGASLQPYLEQANDHLAAIVQIETLAGLDMVEQIAAVPGIDGLCMGPFDLAVSIGHPVGSPAHAAAMDRICRAARDAAIAGIAVCATARQVRHARDAGAKLAIFGMDRMFALQAAAAAAASIEAKPG
ncbi:2-dehydro-3-deoxyglucarate aldolase [Sphingobium fuliginis]|jgi:2-keto-3-deoxy-L-rhamnonate aldolase RhmA|uniref:2-dehydro-3-deoxyglucarate aldolase n=2 Tax=Sphingobium fuliginis (strain ATCC 27551) TaxID=336203 RepID=A0A292ZHG5_SPHSA|nr:2-dehydro-3-deoxyglucarate aldolase [Sphingobium fuliginis]